MKKQVKLNMAILASVLIATACAASTVPESSAVSHVEASATEAVKSSAHNDYVKPGAAVSYSHNLKSSLRAGEMATFELNLGESYNNGTLNVSLATEGDIQLVATPTKASFDMAAGNSHIMNISVTGGNGRHYINVQAVTDAGESRIFGIPVQVGPQLAMKPNKNMVTTSDGENLIIMEAEEVIK